MSTPLKSQNKKQINCRDRDKNKSVNSESGGSSQCDTPPLIDKDVSTSSQGKYAGIGFESIQCMAEQVGMEVNMDVATNLAEDVSYKLRQTINQIALHSEMMKKSCVDSADVNTCLQLCDTSPVVGACPPQFVPIGEDDLCTQHETVTNITEIALTTQSYMISSQPTLSVEWITDDKSLNNSSNISASLHIYYTNIARAILNLRKKLKDTAVNDLLTNTGIGPIFPNLFNLAVLVLNDDNLKALNVPAKKPLQCNVLDMMDALCSNPCSLDTNITQQFQRLFPVMVSNILSNGSLSETMVAVLTKITKTWPSFATLGKEILYDYLLKGPKSQVTSQMIRCLTALGRSALIDCLSEHLDYIDEAMQLPRKNHSQLGIRETILEASTCILRCEMTTYLEDFVATDYTLYEMLGDSIEPRRTIFPYSVPNKDETSKTDSSDEDEHELLFMPARVTRRSKLKLLPKRPNTNIHRELLFEQTNFRPDFRINIRVQTFRNLHISSNKNRNTQPIIQMNYNNNFIKNSVVVSRGMLNRFKYRLNNKSKPFPIFGGYML